MDRYDEKVDKSAGPDACWPWTGGKDTTVTGSSGMAPTGQRPRPLRRASRWTYEQFVGELPTAMKILHSCDNPPASTRRT